MPAKRIIVGLALAAAMAPIASADPFKVSVDQTLTLKLPSPANSVIIGNATVADVSVADASTLLVTGKTFGTTNLMVLDRGGRTIYESQVLVGGGDNPGQLTIVRAGSTYSYSCVDKCRATPMVGDDPEHFSEIMKTVDAKASAATGGN